MTANLGWTPIAESQANKHTTANDGLGRLDAAISDTLDVGVTDSNTASISSSDLQKYQTFRFAQSGSPSPNAEVAVTVAAVERGLVTFVNNTGQRLAVSISGQSEAAATVEDGATVILSIDGSNVRAIRRPYDFGFFAADTPSAGATIQKVVVPRTVTLAANLSGSSGHVETNPAASFAVDLTDDGVSIGTITVSTAGVFTFATDGGTAKTILAGSVVRFIGPSPADAAIAGIAVTLAALLS